MFQQRAVPSAKSYEVPRDRLWEPVPGVDPRRTDSYAVVDERIDRTITLAVARWPRVDKAGRLRFKPSRPVAVDAEDLYEVVTRFRRQQDDDAPDRPLRIGDAFLIRRFRAAQPGAWALVIDISKAARDAAKISVGAAATPAFQQGEDVPPEEEQAVAASPPGPAARPLV